MTRPSAEIVPANIRAVQTIYTAHMLEELHLFDVADRLVELGPPLSCPSASAEARSVLGAYRRAASRRLDAHERLAVYARCLGAPGGDSAAEPNREFDKLWLRFVRAVSSYRRQQTTADVAADKRAARGEAVRKAGRDLAANVSLYGFGAAPAAAALERHVGQALRVLGTAAVRETYGSRDVWQVVERAAAVELGSVPNTVRYRAQAAVGRQRSSTGSRRARRGSRRGRRSSTGVRCSVSKRARRRTRRRRIAT